MVFRFLEKWLRTVSSQLLIDVSMVFMDDLITLRSAQPSTKAVNFSDPLWKSNPENVSRGGERIWNVNLTSPSTEGVLQADCRCILS